MGVITEKEKKIIRKQEGHQCHGSSSALYSSSSRVLCLPLSVSLSSCVSLSLSLFVYLCLYDSPYLSISLSVSLAPPFPLSPCLFIIYLFLCFLSLLPSLSLFLSFFSLSVSHSFHPLDVVSQTKIFIATIAPIKCNTLCTLLHFAERQHDQIFAPS